MQYKRFILGVLSTNCYVVQDGNEAAVIDPAVYSGDVSEFIKKEKLTLKYIILTHTHFDHIGGAQQFKNEFGGKIAVHEKDASGLFDSTLNFGGYAEGGGAPSADILLRQGDTLEVGRCRLTVLHTPGHTAGGICLYCPPVLFSGDTLFEGSIGRFDFPGGSFENLKKSITNKIFSLPESTEVLPGHGNFTTVGREKKENMYLR